MGYSDWYEVSLGRRPADLVLKGGTVVNVVTHELVLADVAVVGDTIVGVGDYSGATEVDCSGRFLCPGFIDAHMHLESTMVRPGELARALLRRGTTTIVADAHELVNVCGASAIDFVLAECAGIGLDVGMMLPSSVPATTFETNGATFTADEMRPYVGLPGVLGLGEVMCYPDVLRADPVIGAKMDLFVGRVRDGHSPGLTGHDLQAYVAAGIQTDHESVDFAEALEKARAGLTVLIREGSAARNLAAIVTGLVASGISTEHFAFCTDDKHFGDIEGEGHIDFAVRKAIGLGLDPVVAIAMASHHAARAYSLGRTGALAPGYAADILVLDDLRSVSIERVYKAGELVGDEFWARRPLRRITEDAFLDTVRFAPVTPERLRLSAHAEDHVIEIVTDQLLTRHLVERLPQADGWFAPDPVHNKLVVVERHGRTDHVAVAALKGYGLHGAAIATTVAHDSHNVLAAGDNDADLAVAINRLAEISGGYVIASGGRVVDELPLPIAGLISTLTGAEVEARVARMRTRARALGVPEGVEPFTTLSFLALPVIPEVRLTDLGLFDVESFALIAD